LVILPKPLYQSYVGLTIATKHYACPNLLAKTERLCYTQGSKVPG